MRQPTLMVLFGRSLALLLGLLLFAGGVAAVAQAGAPAAGPLIAALANPTPPPWYLPVIFKGPPPPVIDLAVNRIEIIQGITMGSAYTVQVAGRPALARVFVSLTGGATQGGVTGRLTRYLGSSAQDSLNAGPITVLSATNEGNLAETLNFNLPNSWLAAGTSYVFQLDPANTIRETNENNNLYPASGRASFNFQNAPVLNVVIVPVHYARPGAAASDPPTNNLSYLNWFPIKVYPLSQINYTVHSTPLVFTEDLRQSNGQGWIDLLNDVTAMHQIEDASQQKEYVALVNSIAVDGCGGGCIAGIGWISTQFGVAKSAVSFAGFPNDRTGASPVITHEMGHTFGRLHAPCGNPDQPDPAYPYANAGLGQWGYDNAAAQLKNPGTYYDYMSYCDPQWTSDYTYQGIAKAWSWVSQPYGTVAHSDLTQAWEVSGSIDPAGQAHVGPAHILAVPLAELTQSGPLRLDLLDGAGRVIATHAFASMTMALDTLRTGFYQQGFRVDVPVVPGLAGFRIYRDSQLLFERRVSGPTPVLTVPAASAAQDGVHLNWVLSTGSGAVTYRVRLSSDGGQNWQVLALDQSQAALTVPAAALSGSTPPIVEVQASDGVRVDTRTIALPRPSSPAP